MGKGKYGYCIVCGGQDSTIIAGVCHYCRKTGAKPQKEIPAQNKEMPQGAITKKAVKGDINNDGTFDDKDTSLAGKTLALGKKKKQGQRKKGL